MAKPMFIRSAKRRFNFTMARLLFGDKSTAPHFALVGPGSANHLCQRIVESGHQRVLIVTDKPLRELGLVDQACETLIKAGIDLVWYDGVQPDPTFTQVR